MRGFARAARRAATAVAITTGFLTLIAAPGVPAAAMDRLSTHDKWTAFKGESDGQTVCYAVTTPTESGKQVNGRSAVFLRVAHWPKRGSRDEVSIDAGATLDDKQSAEATVRSARHDDKKYPMFADGANAWMETPRTDAEVVRAMKLGRDLRFTATVRGSGKVEDVFSLSGFTAAYNSINDACR